MNESSEIRKPNSEDLKSLAAQIMP
ncbi:unnamed protein product, partial [Didymodactylos carnosus]